MANAGGLWATYRRLVEDGWAGFASRNNPRPEPGRSDLGGHLFGGARRAVLLVRVGFGLRGGGAGGLGDARNEAVGQLNGQGETVEISSRLHRGVRACAGTGYFCH